MQTKVDNLRELLESTHSFPGTYMIKVIGFSEDEFVERVVGAAQISLTRVADVQFTQRVTPQGKHVAVTLQLRVESVDEVLTVYEAIRVVRGVSLLL